MTAMPSTVPYGADQTLYLVMDAEGPKGREFHKAVATLPGYVAANTGSVSSVKEFLERMDANR